MLVFVGTALLFAVALVLLCGSARAPRSLWASEESAHSAAARKREVENRQEPRSAVDRSGATVSVLGEPASDRRAPCRIVNLSRSGLRIASQRSFPKDAQLLVQWGDEFFIGTVRYSLARLDEHLAGLQLLSGNYRS